VNTVTSLQAEHRKHERPITFIDLLLHEALLNFSLFLFLQDSQQEVKGRLVGSPGRLDLVRSLLGFLLLVSNQEGSNLELSRDIKQVFLILFIEPMEIGNLDGTLTQKWANKTIAEPDWKARQIAGVVFEVDNRLLNDKFPATRLETS